MMGLEMIDIEPTKENFEIVKELGTKWLMGLATLNAAMVVYVLSNHKESLTVYIAVALVFFAFGTMAALLCGWNVYELFLRYSSVTNLENKYNCIVKSQNGETVCSVRAVLENDRQEEIKKNNKKINFMNSCSIISLAFGMIIYLLGCSKDCDVLVCLSVIGTVAFLAGLVFVVGYYIEC